MAPSCQAHIRTSPTVRGPTSLSASKHVRPLRSQSTRLVPILPFPSLVTLPSSRPPLPAVSSILEKTMPLSCTLACQEDLRASPCGPLTTPRNLPFQFHIIFARLQCTPSQIPSIIHLHLDLTGNSSLETPQRARRLRLCPVLLSLFPKYTLLHSRSYPFRNTRRRLVLFQPRPFLAEGPRRCCAELNIWAYPLIPHKRGANYRSSDAGPCLSSHPPPPNPL